MSDRLQEAASGGGPKKGFSAWIAGRARRREYWAWVVPLLLALFVVGFMGVPGIALLFALPMLFVWIRRLHDLGRSGWWAPVINIAVAVIGWLEAGVLNPGGEGGLAQSLAGVAATVALGAIPGQRRANAYGPPPGQIGDVAETFS